MLINLQFIGLSLKIFKESKPGFYIILNQTNGQNKIYNISSTKITYEQSFLINPNMPPHLEIKYKSCLCPGIRYSQHGKYIENDIWGTDNKGKPFPLKKKENS